MWKKVKSRKKNKLPTSESAHRNPSFTISQRYFNSTSIPLPKSEEKCFGQKQLRVSAIVAIPWF